MAIPSSSRGHRPTFQLTTPTQKKFNNRPVASTGLDLTSFKDCRHRHAGPRPGNPTVSSDSRKKTVLGPVGALGLPWWPETDEAEGAVPTAAPRGELGGVAETLTPVSTVIRHALVGQAPDALVARRPRLGSDRLAPIAPAEQRLRTIVPPATGGLPKSRLL